MQQQHYELSISWFRVSLDARYDACENCWYSLYCTRRWIKSGSLLWGRPTSANRKYNRNLVSQYFSFVYPVVCTVRCYNITKFCYLLKKQRCRWLTWLTRTGGTQKTVWFNGCYLFDLSSCLSVPKPLNYHHWKCCCLVAGRVIHFALIHTSYADRNKSHFEIYFNL